MKRDCVHNQNYKNATLHTHTPHVRMGSVSVEFECFLFTMQMKNLCGVWIFDSRVWSVECRANIFLSVGEGEECGVWHKKSAL